MKRTVIDIGSNSVRLMVHENKETLYKTIKVTRLAQNMKDGCLHVESINRTVQAIKEFCNYSENVEHCKPILFATEAVRSCKNPQDFLHLLPYQVDVISSDTEAQIAYLGAKKCFDGTNLIIDIGGASTEIVVGNGLDILYSKSCPIGVVKILQLCGEDMQKIHRYTREVIAAYGDIPSFDRAIIIGGTGLNLVACTNGIVPYQPKLVHKKSMSRCMLQDFCKKIQPLSYHERELLGVNEQRADLILGGGLLLANILNYIDCDLVYASESDNLEGYLELYERKN